jgi:hypothetical protein
MIWATSVTQPEAEGTEFVLAAVQPFPELTGSRALIASGTFRPNRHVRFFDAIGGEADITHLLIIGKD